MKNKKAILSGIKKTKLKKKLGNKCIYCGCTNKVALTIDHKFPLVRGGKDIEENKQVCCFICNQLKGALLHSEFKRYLKALEILKDLGKLFIKFNEPLLKLKTNCFPLTEQQVLVEIKKESKEINKREEKNQIPSPDKK